METLSVVPIFMSAGAAVLPTVIAAGASIAAIAFKPRELARVARQHPRGMATGLLLATVAIGGTTWGINRLMQPAPAAPKPYAWNDVGAKILNQIEAGRKYTDLGAVASTTKTPDTTPSTQVVQAGGGGAQTLPNTWTLPSSNTNFDGGPSPTKLKQLWSYKPEDAMFLSRPVVANTPSGMRVYTAACQSDLGGYTGLLACVDGETGKKIWEVITDAQDDILKPFFSSPILTPDGKYLIIGQGLHEDRDCSLMCFDTATGKQKWAVKTPLHIESSPVIYGDIAIVGAGAIEGRDGRPTGNPGFVFAVRISTGQKLWEHSVIDPESAPAIDTDGTLYIGSGFNGEAIVALQSAPTEELKGNRQLWKTPVGLPVTGEITIAGDLIIAGAGNGDFVKSNPNPRGIVVALDKKTGEQRWKTTIEDSVLGSIAYHGDRLICPSRTGEILALSVKDGSIIWRTRLSGKAPVLAGTAYTDKRIYAVSSDGYLAVLDSTSGALLEKVPVNDSAKPGNGLTGCPPQVVGGRVLVGTETGGLVCLFGPPAVDGGAK